MIDSRQMEAVISRAQARHKRQHVCFFISPWLKYFNTITDRRAIKSCNVSNAIAWWHLQMHVSYLSRLEHYIYHHLRHLHWLSWVTLFTCLKLNGIIPLIKVSLFHSIDTSAYMFYRIQPCPELEISKQSRLVDYRKSYFLCLYLHALTYGNLGSTHYHGWSQAWETKVYESTRVNGTMEFSYRYPVVISLWWGIQCRHSVQSCQGSEYKGMIYGTFQQAY